MHILSGANGLVGTYIVAQYLRKNRLICCVVRSKESQKRLVQTVEKLLGQPAENFVHLIEFAQGDIQDYYFLEDLINEGDIVLHAAACVSFNPKDKEKLFDVNIEGTRNVVNSALHKKAEKLLFVSSVAAIGRAKEGVLINEETPWIDSKYNSNYAVSKRGAELEVWRGAEEGLKVAIVNPTIILGYTQKGNSSSSIFHNIKKGFPFVSKGINGYVGAEDVAKISVELADSNICNERFVLNGGNISYNDLFSSIARKLEKKPPSINVKAWMKWIVLPVAKLISILTGRAPFVTKEVFRTSMATHKYSASKIEKQLNYQFTPINQVVEETCKLMS